MNKYFLSQIIYDRFRLYTDKKIMDTIDKLRKEVKSDDVSQTGLERVLKKNIDRITRIL